MHFGHARLCVSVCPSPHSHTTALTRFYLEEWHGCPQVVHYGADLQSVHGFRCYDNSAESEMSVSALTRSMPVSMAIEA